MVAKNDITGDKIKTKPGTKQYRDGWDAIFGKQEKAWKEQDKLGPCWGHEVENQKEEQKKDRFTKLQEEFACIDAYFPIPSLEEEKKDSSPD